MWSGLVTCTKVLIRTLRFVSFTFRIKANNFCRFGISETEELQKKKQTKKDFFYLCIIYAITVQCILSYVNKGRKTAIDVHDVNAISILH